MSRNDLDLQYSHMFIFSVGLDKQTGRQADGRIDGRTDILVDRLENECKMPFFCSNLAIFDSDKRTNR